MPLDDEIDDAAHRWIAAQEAAKAAQSAWEEYRDRAAGRPVIKASNPAGQKLGAPMSLGDHAKLLQSGLDYYAKQRMTKS